MRRIQIAGNLSVFSLLAIAGEYSKALQENPDADRKKTLRMLKQKAMEYRTKQQNKSNSEDFLTNNDQVMKRIIQHTKELISMIDEEIKNRQKFYAKQDTRWQNSAKGREYVEETDVLNELLNPLNDAICGLKSK